MVLWRGLRPLTQRGEFGCTSAIVGFLGVLVLIASLIKQHFHPDATARDATQKVGKLKALIRSAEDQLAELITRVDADAGADMLWPKTSHTGLVKLN